MPLIGQQGRIIFLVSSIDSLIGDHRLFHNYFFISNFPLPFEIQNFGVLLKPCLGSGNYFISDNNGNVSVTEILSSNSQNCGLTVTWRYFEIMELHNSFTMQPTQFVPIDLIGHVNHVIRHVSYLNLFLTKWWQNKMARFAYRLSFRSR